MVRGVLGEMVEAEVPRDVLGEAVEVEVAGG